VIAWLTAPFVALARTWRGRFILAFVAVQLAIPLRYYIQHRDPHDERFAWRMFSPMRMARCTPSFTKDDAPINMTAEFHEAWNELVERGRFTVIEAMGAELCKRYPKTVIRVSLECTYLEDEPRHYGGYDMCNVPEL
jgi:hypothetical protein